LSALGRSERHFHPIVFDASVPPGGSPNAEAFVSHDPKRIHLITSSFVFREAMSAHDRCGRRSSLAKIASMVVHEEWHLRHGADEEGAYLAQLATLIQMGFDQGSPTYASVRKAMLHVTRGSPRRAGS
jgi:hypothetical protein